MPVARRKCRVLVVDDEPAMREVLQARLERWGFDVRTVGDATSAVTLAKTFDPHVVVSDLILPDATGLDVLNALRDPEGKRVILLITAYGAIDVAVSAIKAGATDFLTKPLDYASLRRQLEAVDDTLDIGPRTPAIEPTTDVDAVHPGGLVGTSPAQQRLYECIERAAASQAPVLVVGESGSGKELVARSIHEQSPRSGAPFVPVNAAALPEALAEGELFGVTRGAYTGADQARAGLFEAADGGTLFLDEITEMPPSLQPKLLRALEGGRIRRVGAKVETRVDVRIISATNRDLTTAVTDGVFRADLRYRLDVLRIDVPPLRDRRQDIPALVRFFRRRAAKRYDRELPPLSEHFVERLVAHDWPGNVRELRNVVERAVAGTSDGLAETSGSPVSAATQLDQPSGLTIPFGATAAEAERILIMETLRRNNNNKTETARRLGLDVKTIRNKLKSFRANEGTG